MDSTVLLTGGEYGTDMVPTDSAIRAGLATVANPSSKIDRLVGTNILACAELKETMLETVGGKFVWFGNDSRIVKGIPEGYAQVEYLESLDGQECYIATDYQTSEFKHSIVIRGKYQRTDDYSDRGILFSPYSAANYAIEDYSSSRLRFYMMPSPLDVSYNVDKTIPTEFEYISNIDESNSTVLINEQLVATKAVWAPVTSKAKWYLFTEANRRFVTSAPKKIWYIQVIEDDEYKLDMVPVKEIATGKYGMYDYVTGQFYGNLGTGNFTGGPEITE